MLSLGMIKVIYANIVAAVLLFYFILVFLTKKCKAKKQISEQQILGNIRYICLNMTRIMKEHQGEEYVWKKKVWWKKSDVQEKMHWSVKFMAAGVSQHILLKVCG